MVAFDYKFLPVSDMQVNTVEDPKTGKKRVESVLVHDEPIVPSERFWTSLFSRYGFNKAFFTYFSHAEVFERISRKEPNDRMRICIERGRKGGDRLMAVSNPTKPLAVYDDLMGLLEKYEGENITYNDGIVESTHSPRMAGNGFDVGGDMFRYRFIMSTAIDGYGSPNLYLSMLREICSNGVIGYAKAFRSTLALGKGDDDVTPNLTRALDGFNNDEGFAALRQRIDAATQSWASVYETNTLYHLLSKLHGAGQINVDDPTLLDAPSTKKFMEADGESKVGSPVVRAYHGMTGDTSKLYGLANLDALSHKRQRTLPVRCTVYDALNLATEVATHYAEPNGARRLNAWVGTLISSEYDMEGTKEQMGDFADFHVSRQLATPELTGSN